MAGYIVFTREKMRNPSQYEVYRQKAPAAMANQPIKPLAAYGARRSRASPSFNSPHSRRRRPGTTAPPIARPANTAIEAPTIAPLLSRGCDADEGEGVRTIADDA